MRTLSATGLNMIKEFEGLRLVPYKDTAGILTVGYGHAYWDGGSITNEEAEELLSQDIKKFEKAVNKYDDTYKWSQNEFDALVSFAFNLGGIDKLTANGTRGRNTIAEKMLLYFNSGGKKIQGLVERRKKEQALFLKKDTKEEKETCYTCLAKMVWQGVFGEGHEARRDKIESLGFDYEKVREEVNKLGK